MKTIREVMNMNVGEFLGLSVRSCNSLRRVNIEKLSELTAMSKEDLFNNGIKTIDEIDSKLAETGLCWQMTDRDWANWGTSHIEWIKAH